MTRMTLLPCAAATLLLGVAAAACTDDPPPKQPTPPTQSATATRTPTPSATTTPPAPPAPTVLTQDDTGRTVTLPLGDTLQLRLSGPWQQATPAVEGKAIVLVPVDHETDPGFRAWDVRATGRGEAVLHTAGGPGPRAVRITFRVR